LKLNKYSIVTKVYLPSISKQQVGSTNNQRTY